MDELREYRKQSPAHPPAVFILLLNLPHTTLDLGAGRRQGAHQRWRHVPDQLRLPVEDWPAIGADATGQQSVR